MPEATTETKQHHQNPYSFGMVSGLSAVNLLRL
jgi:hypothetical protein